MRNLDCVIESMITVVSLILLLIGVGILCSCIILFFKEVVLKPSSTEEYVVRKSDVEHVKNNGIYTVYTDGKNVYYVDIIIKKID